MPEKAALSVLEVLPAPTELTAVCVVRCIEGTAVLGMQFLGMPPQEENGDAHAPLTLEKIEWYGRDVEQLDTVHSGKVTLRGESAKTLTPGTTLTLAHP
ncbi:hypothetical protein ABZZ79_29800 [Streptomyces sp. NPDC006458]|uniref:hypothetical protein n=1 Tax=Streptomyces sp. NPDC006458 TaxID=3154302 RepID=UPI0033ACB1A5